MDNNYGLNFDRKRNCKILDIGANVGFFSLYASKKLPDSAVYSFEPYPPSFTKFLQHIERNEISNVTPYQYAVSDKRGREKLFTVEWAGCNTMVSDKFEEGNYEVCEVDSITLKELFEITGVSYFDFAKIDCEGSEYQIFLNTPDEYIHKINEFAIEVHNDKKHTYGDLIKKFKELGYKVNYNSNGIMTACKY